MKSSLTVIGYLKLTHRQRQRRAGLHLQTPQPVQNRRHPRPRFAAGLDRC
jgi:hypothetical protein